MTTLLLPSKSTRPVISPCKAICCASARRRALPAGVVPSSRSLTDLRVAKCFSKGPSIGSTVRRSTIPVLVTSAIATQ